MATVNKKKSTAEAIQEDMHKEMTPVEASLPVAQAAENLDEWGAPAPIQAENIVIARILPQQPLSKYATEGRARMGDFVESNNGEVLGGIDKPLEFIPFHYQEVWVLKREKQGMMKFAGIEPVTPQNTNAPLEEVVSGVKVSRDRQYEFYCLLPSDVAKGINRPYVLGFRRTSSRAGKKLYTTMFITNRANGKSPAGTACRLTAQKTSNDKGTFIILDVTEGRESTTAERAAALNWFKTVAVRKEATVDNSSLEQEDTSFPPSYNAEGTQQF